MGKFMQLGVLLLLVFWIATLITATTGQQQFYEEEDEDFLEFDTEVQDEVEEQFPDEMTVEEENAELDDAVPVASSATDDEDAVVEVRQQSYSNYCLIEVLLANIC